MSPNRARSNYAWDDLAIRSAQRSGFERLSGGYLAGDPFSFGGAVSPCVQVFFQRTTSTELGPVAWLGVYVEAFESEWRDRLLMTDVPAEGESPVLALDSRNVRRLRPRPWVSVTPSEPEVSDMTAWLDRAFEYARLLPSSMEDLIAVIDSTRIVDQTLESYLGHPVKVRGLVAWLFRTQGVDVSGRLLPLLPDRTDPYNVDAMLGPSLGER
jgi:hypothetical protein